MNHCWIWILFESNYKLISRFLRLFRLVNCHIFEKTMSFTIIPQPEYILLTECNAKIYTEITDMLVISNTANILNILRYFGGFLSHSISPFHSIVLCIQCSFIHSPLFFSFFSFLMKSMSVWNFLYTRRRKQ